MFSKQIFAVALLGLIVSADVAFGVDPDYNCNVCKYEVGKLLEPGQLNWIESLIVPLLCSSMSILSQKCETFLDKYIGNFINQTQAMGSDKLCIEMGACNATVAVTQKPVAVLAEVGATKSAACDACYLGVEYLLALFGSTSVDRQIATLLEDYVCSKTPATEQLCDQIVTTIMPQVITAITTQLTPQNLCYASPSNTNPPCV